MSSVLFEQSVIVIAFIRATSNDENGAEWEKKSLLGHIIISALHFLLCRSDSVLFYAAQRFESLLFSFSSFIYIFINVRFMITENRRALMQMGTDV